MPTCTGHCCKATIYDSTCQKTPHPRRGALSAACCIQIEKHKENSAVFPGCCILNGAIYVLCFCSESHNILHCSASFCIALRRSALLCVILERSGAFLALLCFRVAERFGWLWSALELSGAFRSALPNSSNALQGVADHFRVCGTRGLQTLRAAFQALCGAI